MSQTGEPLEELGLLVAALCDGEITRGQVARLEEIARGSSEAHRYVLNYVQLHGELYWDHATSVGGGIPAMPAVPVVVPATRPAPRVRWGVLAAAVSLVVAMAWWAVETKRAIPDAVAAHLTRSVGATWQGGAIPEGQSLAAGKRIELADGLAEITLVSGARVILEGPAALELESPERVYLDHGSLAARVSNPAKRLAVRTPNLMVVDLGTEFGVMARAAGASEVHVFAGKVQVQAQSGGSVGDWRLVSADQAVRVALASKGKLPSVEAIPAGGRYFTRTLAPASAGAVAALRSLVRQHPRLVHHYTFEGFTPQEQRRDKRGSLDLTEAVMQSGRGGGRLVYEAAGWDDTTRAIRPYRSAVDGNSSGVALQSESTFQPPPAMTVELLVKFADPGASERMPIACAVATRADQLRCGFLLAAVEHGQLAHLMDGDASWVEAQDDFAFATGDWYYVASTFAVESGNTRVNTYVANLSRGEKNLNWVVRNQLAPGIAPASRLGIGKGFDSNTGHAYPWSGSLDEVAIYDTVLDRKSMEEHLAALVGAETDW